MLTVILTFLKSHRQTTLIASTVLGVMATISVQHLEIGHLRGKLSLCHAENVTLEDSNKKLLSSIQTQNEAIESLQAEAMARKAAAFRALAASRARAGRHGDAAKRILGQPASNDDCADLRKLINDYVGPKR
jgi:uncharacterized protein YlxW (UPF0749 family)